MTQKTDIDGALDATGDYGPYMQNVPDNPFQTDDLAPLFRFGADPGTGAAHWCFDDNPASATYGNLWADDGDTSPDGTPHEDL